MRLKIIGIYGVLILGLGFGISYALDLRLSDNQVEALRISAEKATRHAQAAIEAQGLEIVALAGRAAAVPVLGQIMDQWHKATSPDTRERLVGLFVRERIERDQLQLHQKIVTEKGLVVPGVAAPAAPAEPAPAAGTPTAQPAAGAAPAQPAAQPATGKLILPAALPAKDRTVATTSATAKADVSAKAMPGEEATKAPAPAPAAPAQPAAQPAAGAAPAQPAAQPAAGAAPAQPAAGAAPTQPAAGAAPAQPAAQQQIISLCAARLCTDAEIQALYDLQLLNVRTFLTDPKLGWDACRQAYLADLEADQRRIIDAQIKVIEDRRAAEAAVAAAAAATRRGADVEAPVLPPAEIPFEPNRAFAVGKYPACEQFNVKAQLSIINEMNGKIFSTLGYQAAAVAFRQITDLTRSKVEFVWLLDQETGRGIAKNNEFKQGTADAYYYMKDMGEIFEGLAGGAGQKILQSVRAGSVYRDIWVTREDLGDSLTGFVHVALVPVLGPEGDTVALLVAAVRMENLARIARAAHAKILLVRKTNKQGTELVQMVGDGNDDEKVEALPDGFRKELLKAHDADLRGVAGIDPNDVDGKGIRPPFDFEYGGTSYLGQVSGVVNTVAQISRGEAAFAVGPVAVAALVDQTQAMEILSTIWQVWIFTGIAFLIAVIVALLLARSFLRPITLIEDGLLRIMNGDWTHRFEVKSAELGGLSYRINQLMAALLGDEEEGEMEGAAEATAAADPREAYYQGLYAKFQAAQQQIKQDPNSVSFADFKARLVDNERKILEKNPGKQVEFEILVDRNQITFKPIVK